MLKGVLIDVWLTAFVSFVCLLLRFLLVCRLLLYFAFCVNLFVRIVYSVHRFDYMFCCAYR